MKRCLLWLVILALLVIGIRPADALWTSRSGARADHLITVRELASRYNLTISSATKKLILQNQTTTIELSTEGREARLNGQQIWLHAPMARSWGR